MPAFCPHACIRFCEAVVSTCRSLACLSRCTRTVGLTAGAEWLCHGCVYACLSLALRCAYIYASGLHRAVVLTNRHCYAWLGCCWLLRWLADCLDVKRDLQARFCDRPDAIVVCTRQAGMNTKRTWASRVLACIIDRKSGRIVGGGFFFRQGANCEGWSLVWSTIECDTGLATSYEGSSGCRGPILCISRGAHTVPDVSFVSGRRRMPARPGGCVAQ
jgi:hypothetical protein